MLLLQLPPYSLLTINSLWTFYCSFFIVLWSCSFFNFSSCSWIFPLDQCSFLEFLFSLLQDYHLSMLSVPCYLFILPIMYSQVNDDFKWNTSLPVYAVVSWDSLWVVVYHWVCISVDLYIVLWSHSARCWQKVVLLVQCLLKQTCSVWIFWMALPTVVPVLDIMIHKI